VEDRAAGEDGALQLVRGQVQTRLLPQLPQRARADVLPRLEATADREPPGAARLPRVVAAHEEEAVGVVEEDDARGAPEGHAVGAGHPVGAQPVGRHQPRSARRCGTGISSTLRPTIASPRPRETSATTAGSSKKVVARTMAAARCAGLPDLKMPEPTKTPWAPSCIIIAASAGVAMPPAVKR